MVKIASRFFPTLGHRHPKKVARARILIGAVLIFASVCGLTAICSSSLNFSTKTVAILSITICLGALIYGICCFFSGINIMIRNYLGSV